MNSIAVENLVWKIKLASDNGGADISDVRNKLFDLIPEKQRLVRIYILEILNIKILYKLIVNGNILPGMGFSKCPVYSSAGNRMLILLGQLRNVIQGNIGLFRRNNTGRNG